METYITPYSFRKELPCLPLWTLSLLNAKFIERMKGDMSLVSQFYDDPAATLGEAGVSEEFSNAVLRRDGKALLAMGWGSEEMEVAFSGRHTSNQFYCSK